MKMYIKALIIVCLPILSSLVSLVLYHCTFSSLSDLSSYVFTALGTLVAIGTAIPAITAYFVHQSIKEKSDTAKNELRAFARSLKNYKKQIQKELQELRSHNQRLDTVINEYEIRKQLDHFIKTGKGDQNKIESLLQNRYFSLELYTMTEIINLKRVVNLAEYSEADIIQFEQDLISNYRELIKTDDEYHQLFTQQAINTLKRCNKKPEFLQEIHWIITCLIEQDEYDKTNIIPKEQQDVIKEIYQQNILDHKLIALLHTKINKENIKTSKLSLFLGLNHPRQQYSLSTLKEVLKNENN